MHSDAKITSFKVSNKSDKNGAMEVNAAMPKAPGSKRLPAGSQTTAKPAWMMSQQPTQQSNNKYSSQSKPVVFESLPVARLHQQAAKLKDKVAPKLKDTRPSWAFLLKGANPSSGW